MQGKIGVLGGTFNPVHIGHLILAQDAFVQFQLAKVLFVPCAVPPHKQTTGLAPVWHRVAMLQRAIEGDFRFEMSDVEVRRPGVSYSIDTIRALRQAYPGCTLVFIVGADTLLELAAWKDVYDLLTLCEFGVMLRPGFDVTAADVEKTGLRPPWPEKLLGSRATGHAVGIASSDVRYRIAEGLSIRYLVPPDVEMYIAEHSLYRG